MINFHEVAEDNTQERNKFLTIRILMVGNTGSRKANSLLSQIMIKYFCMSRIYTHLNISIS